MTSCCTLPLVLVSVGVNGGGRDITAPKTLVATGRRTLVPAIRGIEDVDLLDLRFGEEHTGIRPERLAHTAGQETLPASLIFVGTG